MNKLNNITPQPKLGWLLAALTLMMITLNLDLTVANLALSSVDKTQIGMATGLFYTCMFISSAIGVAIASFILSTASATYLSQELFNTALTAQQLASLKAIASGAQPIAIINNLFNTPAAEIQTFAYQAFMSAFSQLMQWCLGLSLLGFLMTFYLKRPFQYTQ